MRKLLTFILLFLFCAIALEAQEIERVDIQIDTDREIYKVVEQMPRFPGCEDMIGSTREKEECAKEKMLAYIYSNLKYPEEAKLNKIQGMCVIQFIVDIDGSIVNAKILRDIGSGAGEAALEVVRNMNLLEEKWTAGEQGGNVVRVYYTLPVRFKLENNTVKKKEVIKNYHDGKIHRIVLNGIVIDSDIANFTYEDIDLAELDVDEETGEKTLYLTIRTEEKSIRNGTPDIRYYKAFPTPIEDELNLSFSYEEEGDLIVQLMTLDGELIQEFSEMNHSGLFNKTIDLSNEASGTMLITMKKNGKFLTHAIIKK